MSPIRRLSTLIGLPRAERTIALRALLVLAAVRAALAALPFRRVRAVVDALAGRRSAIADESEARAVRRAVDRAARTVPGSACLAQALAAEILLRRAGCPAHVRIGVAPDGRPLDAHAWVESAGVVVTGDADDLHRYQTLLDFGAPGVPSDG